MNKPMPDNTPSPDQVDAAHRDVDAHVTAAGVSVDLEGQTFAIAPMRVKQFFPFLQLARPLFAALVKVPSSPTSGLPPTDAGTGQGGDPVRPKAAAIDVEAAMGSATWIMDALETHGPTIIEALAIGITPDAVDLVNGVNKNELQLTVDKVGELSVVSMVTLVKHFVKVNADFFAGQGLRLSLNLPLKVTAVAAKTAQAPKRRNHR